MINKNGHWTYENITLTIPDEGSEGYIENNRGKITYKIYFVITSILKSNPDKKERKIFYSFLYWGNSNSKYVVVVYVRTVKQLMTWDNEMHKAKGFYII